jgi:Nucleotidyl transferase AbiEii toxin, Type IV TA system
MFDNILSNEQKELLPFVQSFKREFYLVGGTAISLHIGHRTSIDFDLFKFSNISKTKIDKQLRAFGWDYQLIFTDSQSFHIVVNEVKMTFFQFPFKVPTNAQFESIKMPDLLHLAAMKAYALGRRAKWKDYVDLYFILKDHHSFEDITVVSKTLFGNLFSEKLFRQQLCYFKDIDYREEVDYLIAPISDEEIKSFLINIAA